MPVRFTRVIAAAFTPQRALDGIATALNRLLAEQAAVLAQLQPLAGRAIDVRVTRLGWRMCVAIEPQGLVLATRSARQADVTIEGTLTDLIAMGRARQRGEPVPAGRVRIEGDLATVQQAQAAFAALDLDWEALLARYVGGLPARQIARVIQGLLSFGTRARAAVEQDLGEYLRTESRRVPAPVELEDFASVVLRTASDVDRLAARLARLQQRRRTP